MLEEIKTHFNIQLQWLFGFPGSSASKESACNTGDPQTDSWVRKIHWRQDRLPTLVFLGFPSGSAGKESTCNMRDLGPIPGLGRSFGEGNGYPFQYSGLENSMNSIVHGVAKSWIRLTDFHFHYILISESVMPPALFFSFKVAWTIWNL